MSDNAMAMVSNKSSASFTLIKSVHLIDFFLFFYLFGSIHISVYNLCLQKITSRNMDAIFNELNFLNKHASHARTKA